MAESLTGTPVRSRCIGEMAVVYATDYLNKLSGERIERECRLRLEEGCRALVINFRDTELVNSIGVSILLGVIDAAEGVGAQLVFSDVNKQTVELFEMLGLTKYVALAQDEQEALNTLTEFRSTGAGVGH
ncbi:MAG TPA: STAS domain-containing protein [Pyrinomonadaceae bacterium]|jgi:anti-anti-sigma factor|nr:STAS domain-containing protein [Pyrinomonadaceae bacterium]